MLELNKIYNEPCLETLSKMDNESVDLLLQDTPFGVTQNDWDIKPNLPVMWQQWSRVIKDNGAMLFFATQPFASELILSNLKDFRYDLVWYKALGTGFLNANKMPMRNHEYVLVFYRKLPTYNPQMTIGKMKDKGNKGSDTTRGSSNYGKFNPTASYNNTYYPQSVIDFTNGDRTRENEHPTQKPLDLIRYLIRTYSNENDLVFDGYMGSGTTAHACIMEGRNFIGSETNETYYKNSLKRIELELSKPELF